MATRYWVGGSGTWDGSNTANWSTSSGGSGGASVPGSADSVVFNVSSGSGSVAVSSPPAIGGFNSVGSSVSVSGGNVDMFSGSVSLGTNTSFLVQSGRSITLTSNGFSTGPSTIDGTVTCTDAFTGSPNLGSSATLTLKSGVTSTVVSITWPGSAGGAVLNSSTPGVQATLSDTAGTNTVNYITVQDIAFAGGATWSWGTGSVDNGNNTGIGGGASLPNILFGAIA